MLDRLATQALTLLPPEEAHRATVSLLKSPLAPKPRVACDPMLRTSFAGLDLPNPLGMAAGFDKNAEVAGPLLDLGFGFVEVGAVTPRPQPGNPSPRVFRLRMDRAVINRYGFNNDGLDAIAARLKARAGRPGVVGINLGANKDSEDRAQDFVTGLVALEDHVSFLTVNVSSPNTEGLRSLQGRQFLAGLLGRVLSARRTGKPVFVKVAPDLTDEEKADIAAAAMDAGVDGMIVSNTTLDRTGLHGPYKDEKGGLSGKPLFEKSTAVLRDFARETKGALPLVGVGGVFTAGDVVTKLKAGAGAVQLYTAMVYEGPGLVKRIIEELPKLLRAEGFGSVRDAVGAGL
ncbi:quinone-dependent dihydroorotate dehydrogenase [Parvularcula lutaonensis]|uniref:Dihydroorotate dehydrogenase (quinone) n=1 Tax=Parvularcula lutaonensis TaxID=491923 RepID=A0ABV7MD39_9PROT|nr:quinone-dependent dihydroorotate dehydrogenase [Parvularcula lutaonensis]GGY52130.1 dihydroorotate dehydrogenase (quinone) [Parvularcula lutaonensis]